MVLGLISGLWTSKFCHKESAVFFLFPFFFWQGHCNLLYSCFVTYPGGGGGGGGEGGGKQGNPLHKQLSSPPSLWNVYYASTPKSAISPPPPPIVATSSEPSIQARTPRWKLPVTASRTRKNSNFMATSMCCSSDKTVAPELYGWLHGPL